MIIISIIIMTITIMICYNYDKLYYYTSGSSSSSTTTTTINNVL